MACYHSAYYAGRPRSLASRTYLDNNNANTKPIASFSEDPVDYNPTDLIETCNGVNYVPFTASELRSTAALSIFGDDPPLRVEDGGRLTCSFDDPREYCSWYNVAADSNLLRFWMAHYEIPLDIERFRCTTQRDFKFDSNFLMAGGEPVINPQIIAIEAVIPCQYDDATLKFDFWTNSDEPYLRYCVVRNDAETNMDCRNIGSGPNPINITIPQSSEPFKLRVEVLNIKSESIVLLDNLYYEGRICQLVDDEQITSSTQISTSTTHVAETSENFFLNSLFPYNYVDQVSPYPYFNQQQQQLAPPPTAAQGLVSFAEPNQVIILPTTTTTTTTTSPLVVDGEFPIQKDEEQQDEASSVVGQLSVCESLICNFNEKHSCYYGLSGIGSTGPWSIGNRLIGNRHTGIQRINLKDVGEVGFAYVGEDGINHIEDVFVMESPKFTLNQNINIVFDVYVRSKGPKLKVCLDSFDYCPYSSPEVRAKVFWHPDQKVFLSPATKKVYFIVEDVAKNLFLAIDNIRVESESGTDPCASEP